MLFHTFDFLLFAIPVLCGFWALAGKPAARVAWLLAASYLFYMGGPKTDPLPTPWYYAGLLLFSTVLDYVCAHRIHAEGAASDAGPAARRRRNGWLIASLVGNLGLLGYFKYTNFMLSAFRDIAGALGMEVVVPHLELLLPVGISFYTFQSLSYTIDVWRDRLTPERSFPRFALFVVLFPQLVAGPIVRASEFLPQLRRAPQISAEGMSEGMFRIAKGLAKKVLLGDLIAARFTDAVFAGPGLYSSAELLLALYAFTLQLYADFSGYSDIAIGVARLLGFKIPENFDRPHQARDLGEFWRRWHMTLSTWLRDYLFFPLGGSRCGPIRNYFNLWLTMFLVGMWHGASWNFVIYSNLQGFAMLFGRWNRLRAGGPSGWGSAAVLGLGLGAAIWWLSGAVLHLDDAARLPLAAMAVALFVLVTWLPRTGGAANTAVHVLLTFHFTVLSRVFFRADDLDTSRAYIAGLVGWDGRGLRPGLLAPELWALLVLGTAYHFTPKRWVDDGLGQWFRRLPGPVLGAGFALLCWLLMNTMADTPKAFIYFNF